MAKSIAKNSILNFLLKFTRLVVPILIIPYLQRMFDKELYGAFNDASTWVNFAMIFGVFGIATYGLREMAAVRDDRERSRQLYSSLFAFNLITNFTALAVYLLIVLCSADSLGKTIYVILGFKLFANAFMVEWVNEAMENYRFITIKSILVRLLYIVLIFVMIRKPDDVAVYTFVVVLTDFLNNFISFLYVGRKLPISFRNLEIKRHIPMLLPLLLISNTDQLYTQLDKMMLGRVVDEVAVTIYHTPQQLTYMVSVLLASVALVAVPRLSYYNHNGLETEYNALVQKSYRSFMLLVFPCCIGIACLAPEIMWICGDGRYDESIPVLIVFALRTIESSVYIICANQVLYVKNRERFLVKALLGFGLCNLLFNSILVACGCYTPTTAIGATFLAEILLTILLFWYIQHKLNIPLYFFSKDNLRYAGLSLLFVPITFLIKRIDFTALLPNGLLSLSAVNTEHILDIFLIIGGCVICYFGLLLLSRDETLFFLMGKVLGRFRKK